MTAVLIPTPTGEPAATPTIAEPALGDATPLVTESPTADLPPSPRRLVGYLASWTIGSDYSLANIPADRLTHLNYAFAGVSASGECVLGNPKVDGANLLGLHQLKQRNPSLRTSISISSGGSSDHLPGIVADANARHAFAQSCVRLIKQYGLDGVDLDWEYPSGTDQRQGLTLLLAELRSQLDQQGASDGRQYLLTIAAPAGPSHYASFDLGTIQSSLDWLNLMTYAFHGSWDTTTNFDSPLYASSADPSPLVQRLIYNTDAAVQAYLAAGVPATKIVVGVPFYGRGWKGVPDANHGLYQPANGVPPGTRAPGIFTYRDVKDRLLATFDRYWHDEAQVPWLYNPSTGVMITYDDPQSLANKAAYVLSKRLGGIMAWELSSDDTQHSLVAALATNLQRVPTT